MRRKSDAVLYYLKDHYHPFTHFSSKALIASADALRQFKLREGDTLTLQGGDGMRDYLYVTEGSVEVQLGEDTHNLHHARHTGDPFLLPPAPDKAIVIARENASVCHADSAIIDDFLSLDELSVAGSDDVSEDANEVLLLLRNRDAFRNLSLEAVQNVVNRMERVCLNVGDEVIRQHEKGEDFFVILDGEAEVWREELEDDEPQLVAVLKKGSAFGEEALVIGGSRNATIKMITDGTLLKLGKDEFDKLLKAPLMKNASPQMAKAMIDAGTHKIIDVRYEEEYEESFIPGSILLPLPDIRARSEEMDKEQPYLILCAAGVRASAATLLLQQRDFDATVIEGGIKKWPYETRKNMDLELILFDHCPFAQRALITLYHADILHKATYIDHDDRPDWFAEVSPLGKVPILRVDGQTNIFESSVINEFIGQLAQDHLLPADPIERTMCRSWIEFGSSCLVALTQMIMSQEQKAFEEKRAALWKNFAVLEDHLSNEGPFFTGKHFTLVDSTYAPLFLRIDQLQAHVNIFNDNTFPKIVAWGERLIKMDAVKRSTPENFSSIYHHFIEMKGKGGYVHSLMNAERLAAKAGA